MEIEKKPSTNEETYRIYNYFKKYPGILLSAVSVLTAVLAVVANALAFLYQYIKFQKWNINILKWGLPFKGKAYKALEPALQIVRLARLNEKELHRFIIKRLQAKGLQVEKSLPPFLAERSFYLTRPSETSLYQLANMVDAVSGLAEEGRVTLKAGQSLFSDPVEENIFKLMDAISRKDGCL